MKKVKVFIKNFIHKHMCEFPRDDQERVEYLENSIERLVNERNRLVGFDGKQWEIVKM